MSLVGVGTYEKILRPSQYSTLAGMDPLKVELVREVSSSVCVLKKPEGRKNTHSDKG